MSPERFEQLSLAFGGEIDRWPAVEREAARRLLIAQAAVMKPHLDQARRLDRTLDDAPAARPSRELLSRIIQSAPKPRAARVIWSWLAGLGLATAFAGAAAAGVAAGLLVGPAALSAPHAAPGADPGEEAAMLLREPSSDLGEG